VNRRTLLLASTYVGLFSMTRPVRARQQPRIVFLNPGESVERGAGPYWRLVAQAMSHAATSLGMNLEVLYGERDHLVTLRQAEQLAQRADPPDYVVIVNEKLTATTILQMFARSPAKILLIHNDLTPEQRREIGNERQKIRNWIGTITSNGRSSGYMLIEYLYGRLGDREPRIIAITGDPLTPVSRERADGMEDYVVHAKRGTIHQLMFGDWTYNDAEQKASVLLERYPDTNIIWAANDAMALGALRAVKAKGAPVLVGGMGGWPNALVSVREGGLTATAAGGSLIGALATVLLHDYHRGRDFAGHGGLNQSFDQVIVHRQNLDRFDQVVMKGLNTLDVTRYSKFLNPAPGPYRFSLADLVNGRG